MRNGILAAGNWILDTVKTVDIYPQQDCLANILSEQVSNGGGPYNLLVDLARMGVVFPLNAAGLVGDDAAGNHILAHCAANGIDTSRLRRTGKEATSYTDVMSVAGTGRRTFFHRRGANALLDESCLEVADSNDRIFYLGYLLLLDALDRQVGGETGATIALRRAKEVGMTTAVDLVSEDSDRYRDVVRPALGCTDILFVNEIEAERTTGVTVTGPASCPEAAQALFRLGVGQAVFIHLPHGAYGRSRLGETVWQGSVQLPVDQIVSAVGAGDAFAAGVLAGWHEGAGMEECLKQGVCVAAACLRDATTSGGVGSLKDCLALGDEYGFRA